MTEVYRLVKAERADDALSGDGARLYGGRWNPPGCPVVYASQSRALAVLEAFVHLTLEARAMPFLLYEIALPKRTRLERLAGEFALNYPHPPASSQEAGRAWLDDGTALALVVPSVIVPQEASYVLNVRHSQFARVRVTGQERFSFDERLWQSRSAIE